MKTAYAASIAALVLSSSAIPASAYDYGSSSSTRYNNDQHYSRDDMDRYGRDQYDRGYRSGRGGSDNSRNATNTYRRTSSSDRDEDRGWFSDYDRGYQMGREDERRSRSSSNRDD